MDRRDEVALYVFAALCVLLLLIVKARGEARPAPAPALERAAWEEMDAAQLSWVIEGIQERMSELRDDLARAQVLQAEKLAALPPPG